MSVIDHIQVAYTRITYESIRREPSSQKPARVWIQLSNRDLVLAFIE